MQLRLTNIASDGRRTEEGSCSFEELVLANGGSDEATLRDNFDGMSAAELRCELESRGFTVLPRWVGSMLRIEVVK